MTDAGSQCLQISAVVAGSLSIIACGSIFGWSIPVLQKLENFDDPGNISSPLCKPITKDEGSWIDTILYSGILLGTVLPALCAKSVGSHFLLLSTSFLFAIAWTFVGTARVLMQLYFGRFLLGLVLATPLVVFPIYIAEMTNPSIRGTLASLIQLTLASGSFYAQILGPHLTYQNFVWSCAAFHVLFFLIFLHMPQSPYFLLKNGLRFEAAKTLARLTRANEEKIQTELKRMQTTIDNNERTNSRWTDLVCNSVFRRSILLAIVFMSLPEFMGRSSILLSVEPSVERMFRQAEIKSRMDPKILIGFIQVIASAIVPFIIDLMNRKMYLIISSIGCCLSTGMVGIFLYLKSQNLEDILWPSTPVVSLIFYVIFFCLGWGSIVWIMLGEVFAENIKFRGAAIGTFFMWASCLALGKIFANVERSVGLYGNFCIFSISSLAGLIFVIFFLPETGRRSLDEIQTELTIQATSLRRNSHRLQRHQRLADEAHSSTSKLTSSSSVL